MTIRCIEDDIYPLSAEQLYKLNYDRIFAGAVPLSIQRRTTMLDEPREGEAQPPEPQAEPQPTPIIEEPIFDSSDLDFPDEDDFLEEDEEDEEDEESD